MVVGDGNFNVGQLTKFDWKLSMACSSNNCKNLDAPTVTLKFHLKDESNRETTKTVEMTLNEFQVI